MSLKVEIYDQTYTVAGDLEPAYVEELAQYVDGARMREIARGTNLVDSVKVAVLAALSIADELETLRRSRGDGREELRERAERCLKLVERALQQSSLAAEAQQTAGITEAPSMELRHEKLPIALQDHPTTKPPSVYRIAEAGGAATHGNPLCKFGWTPRSRRLKWDRSRPATRVLARKVF